jgi:hypothetical protein
MMQHMDSGTSAFKKFLATIDKILNIDLLLLNRNRQ